MKVLAPRLAHSAVINVVTRSVAVGLGLLITLLAARLGPEAVGVFALFTAVESALLALCSGGGIALARRVSHFGRAPGAALSALLMASLLLGGCLAGGVWALSQWGGAAYAPLWLLAWALPCLLLTPNVSGLWLGQGRMAPLAWLSVGTPALALMAWGVAVLSGAQVSLLTLLGAWVGARVVVGVLSALAGLQGSGWQAPDGGWLRAQGGAFLTLGLTNLISLMNYKADVFLLEHLQGLAATGIYALAVMMAELLWFVSTSLSQAAFARIGTPDRAQAIVTVLRVMHFSVAALLCVAPLLWLAAVVGVPWLFGPAYAEVGGLLAVLLPGVLAYAPASVLSAYFTNHAGRPVVPALMAATSLLINVAVCWVAIPRWGAWGAAVATTASYGLTMVCLLSLFRVHSACSWRRVLWPRAGQLRDDARTLLSWWRVRQPQPPRSTP